MEAPGSTHTTDAAHNERYWDDYSEGYHRGHVDGLPTDHPTWSVWGIPEAELGVLGSVADRDVIELGCGGAQFSIGLARQGARCTCIDISGEQLDLARRLRASAEEDEGHELAMTFVHGDVEQLPMQAGSYDVAFSDYGASMFADPLRWVPEAARVLRPGGVLAFSTVSPMLESCWPRDGAPVRDRLVRDYFNMHRVEQHPAVHYNLTYGSWIRLFRSCGLELVDMVETRPPDGVTSTPWRSENQVAWARRWPSESIWVLQRPVRDHHV